jgi:hypothetical protein
MWPRAAVGCLLACVFATGATAGELPGAYFRLMEAGIAQVEKRLAVEPLDLEALEAGGDGYSLFPHVVLVGGQRYTRSQKAQCPERRIPVSQFL